MPIRRLINGRGANALRGLLFCLLAVCGCGGEPVDPHVVVNEEVLIAAPRRLGVNVGMTTYFNDNHVLADPLVHGDFAKGRRVTLTQVAAAGADAFAAADEGMTLDRLGSAFTGGSYWIGAGAGAGRSGTIEAHRGAELVIGADARLLAPGDWVWLRSAPQSVAQPARTQGERFLGIGDFRIAADAADVRLVDAEAGGYGQAVRSDGGPDATMTLSHYVRLFAGNAYRLKVRARGSDGVVWSARLFRAGRDGEQARSLPICGEIPASSAWIDSAHEFLAPSGLREGEGIWRLDVIARHPAENAFFEIDAVSFLCEPANAFGVDQRVVDCLQEAGVGVLRFLGSASMGGIVEDITAAAPGQASWTYYGSDADYTLHRAFGVVDQWMRLCETLDAVAWIPVGAANTPEDWHNLISYLAAPAGFDAYADKRAGHGRVEPWTDSVTVYLEPGNEWWNRIGPPFHLNSPETLGPILSRLFEAARAHPHFDPDAIRLVAGGWAANPNKWTLPLHRATTGHDVIGIAPYFPARLARFEDDAEMLRTFFSETDAYLAYSGRTTLDGLAGPGRPDLAVYEINHHLTDPAIPAAIASRFSTSYGAAVSVADRTLSVMHGLGADPVALFQLFQRNYRERDGLWGLTLRRSSGAITPRPLWQAMAMLNEFAIEGDMVDCDVRGGPRWNQAENGPAPAMKGVPALHAFAFQTGGETGGTNVVLVNRSLDETLTVRIDLPHAADPSAELVTFIAPRPAANNEDVLTASVTGPDSFRFEGYCDVPPGGIRILRVKSPAP